MKRSQRGCRACEAKACGASPWIVGYVVGAHTATLGEDDEPQLCALHRRLGREASVKALVSLGKGIAARMSERASQRRGTAGGGT